MVTPGARRTRARSGAAHICLADRAQPIRAKEDGYRILSVT